MVNKLVDTFHKYVRLERVFKPIIEFLGLSEGPPIRLVYLAYVMGVFIWLIWSKVETFFQLWLGISPTLSTYFKYVLIALILVISSIFFALYLTLMFPLERRVRVLARSYSEEDELIIFLTEEIKKWLTLILNLIKQSKADKEYTDSQLEKIENEISNKGGYLEFLVTEVSNSLQVSKESVEELIGLKIGVEKQIAKAIIYNHKWIQNANYILKSPFPLLKQKHIDYYRKQISEKTNDIQTKKQLLNTQVKWIEQLENQRGNIKTLLKIIKEESTGKAITILVELLKTATTHEQLKFLIPAANARVGYKLGELLGFRLRLKADGETKLTWYDKPVSNDLTTIRDFLVKFERLRDESIEELIIAFKNYETIDYTQPISIALTFGYSAVLARVLRNIIREANQDKGQAKDLYIKLITGDGFKTLRDKKYLPSGEKLLRDELISTYPDIKERCNIFPIDTIKERGMEGQINKIFIGIESINKLGNVVHPRGGHNTIKHIKEKNSNVKVYAFGETYKVQDFDDFHIDYTKLSMLEGNKYIDYIVTDHKVHVRDMFSWNEIPGNDTNKFIEFLRQNFDINWVKTAKIDKIDGDMTIKVSSENNSLSLKLNNEKNKVTLTIDDGRTDEFIAKTENGKLNIIHGWNLDCCIDHWKNKIK